MPPKQSSENKQSKNMHVFMHFRCRTGDWTRGCAHAVHTLGKHPTSELYIPSSIFFLSSSFLLCRFHFEARSKQVARAGFKLICRPGWAWPCYPPASASCIAEILSLHPMAGLESHLTKQTQLPRTCLCLWMLDAVRMYAPLERQSYQFYMYDRRNVFAILELSLGFCPLRHLLTEKQAIENQLATLYLFNTMFWCPHLKCSSKAWPLPYIKTA